MFTKNIKRFFKNIPLTLPIKTPSFIFNFRVAFLLLILLTILSINLIYLGKIFPGLKVAGVNVGNKTPTQAAIILSEEIKRPESVVLEGGGRSFEIKTSEIDLSYNFEKTARRAYSLYRTGNPVYDYVNRIKLPFKNIDLGLSIEFNEDELQKHLSIIAGQVSTEFVEPKIEISGQNLLVINGKKGRDVNTKKLRTMAGEALVSAQDNTLSIPIDEIDPRLTDEEERALIERAKNLVGKSLILNFETNRFTYNDSHLANLINPDGGYKNRAFDRLLEEIKKEIERPPQNPIFVYKDGKVEEFAPAKDGVEVDRKVLIKSLTEKLKALEKGDNISVSIEVPVNRSEPPISTHEVNDLGINKLLGRGTSKFAGSISSRIHNIGVASSKFNGQLVKPGEIFSFNEVLGDVSSYTGYKQAYIIKDGKTVLGDGGGVCQVSTTLFRAILDAGLPIVERSPHSYRVSYYEQDSPPGLDATIYSPYVDLKFKNDTPNHLLIQTQFVPKDASLVFEIYGTDDERVIETTKPAVAGVTEPPPDKYIEDPSLPEGTIKQIEHKAWGARVRFNHRVKKEGEVIFEKSFYSNYKPWQAVYLRGVGPAN